MSLPQKDARCPICLEHPTHKNAVCIDCPVHSHDYGKQPCKYRKRYQGEAGECLTRKEAEAILKRGGKLK